MFLNGIFLNSNWWISDINPPFAQSHQQVGKETTQKPMCFEEYPPIEEKRLKLMRNFCTTWLTGA